jgi:hypothetical protein
MSDLDKWLEEGRRLDDGTSMSDERLGEVFDLVKPEEHWKYPIDARVPKQAARRDEITRAVVWFAGGTPTVTDEGDQWHVEGEGYYVWIGA